MDTKPKLSFMGIGPRVGAVVLPLLAVTIAASIHWPYLFRFTVAGARILFYIGAVFMLAGLIFYLSTVRFLLKGLKETRLMTTGPYSLCQNPLYSSIILLVIPALSLMMNSWLILVTTFAGYIVFRICISHEYSELQKFFGEDYEKYRSETPEFFPFPFRKWFKS